MFWVVLRTLSRCVDRNGLYNNLRVIRFIGNRFLSVFLWFFQQWSVKAAVSEWFLSGVCVIEILVLSENDSSLRGINSSRNNLRFIAVWCRSRLGVCLGFFCTSSVHCWASDSKGIDLCYPAVWHWHLLFDDRDQPGDHGTL